MMYCRTFAEAKKHAIAAAEFFRSEISVTRVDGNWRVSRCVPSLPTIVSNDDDFELARNSDLRYLESINEIYGPSTEELQVQQDRDVADQAYQVARKAEASLTHPGNTYASVRRLYEAAEKLGHDGAEKWLADEGPWVNTGGQDFPEGTPWGNGPHGSMVEFFQVRPSR